MCIGQIDNLTVLENDLASSTGYIRSGYSTTFIYRLVRTPRRTINYNNKSYDNKVSGYVRHMYALK